MATTLTQKDMISPCQSPKSRQGNGMEVEDGGEDDAPIPFHKHCQKTVLAARGTDQSEGATWSTISGLWDSCISLKLINGNWINLFSDGNNITDDLAAILQLINTLAQRLNTSFELKIQTQDGDTIDSNTIQPFNPDDTYTFTIGRQISLNLDGQTIKFNTAKPPSSDDTLTLKFPRSNVSFFVDDEEQDGFGLLLPKENGEGGFQNAATKEVQLKTDANKVRSRDYYLSWDGSRNDPYKDQAAEVDGTAVVYRARRNPNIGQTTFFPRAFIAMKYYPDDTMGENDPYPYPILQWEYHIENISSDMKLQIGSPSMSYRHEYWGADETTDWRITQDSGCQKVIALTEKNWVEPGMVSVYVYRYDARSKIVTYSLAYQYEGSMNIFHRNANPGGSEGGGGSGSESGSGSGSGSGSESGNGSSSENTSTYFKETVNDIEWTYRIVNEQAIVQNISGSAIPIWTSGVVTVPSTLGGRSVVSIGDYAFSNCSDLTGVAIPLSVTSIGEDAFRYCIGLTFVAIPSGVTDIMNGAFMGCYNLTSVAIPDSVTSIGTAAFQDCSGLTSLTIGNGVTSIGNYAFEGCSRLGGILNIPASVTEIGRHAFEGCRTLTNVVVQYNANLTIGPQAFYDCSALQQVRFMGRSTLALQATMANYPWGISNTYIIRGEI